MMVDFLKFLLVLKMTNLFANGLGKVCTPMICKKSIKFTYDFKLEKFKIHTSVFVFI